MTKKKQRKGETPVYECWIDITTDYGRHLTIDCDNAVDLNAQYRMLLTAWQQYYNDEPIPPIDEGPQIIGGGYSNYRY